MDTGYPTLAELASWNVSLAKLNRSILTPADADAFLDEHIGTPDEGFYWAAALYSKFRNKKGLGLTSHSSATMQLHTGRAWRSLVYRRLIKRGRLATLLDATTLGDATLTLRWPPNWMPRQRSILRWASRSAIVIVMHNWNGSDVFGGLVVPDDLFHEALVSCPDAQIGNLVPWCSLSKSRLALLITEVASRQGAHLTLDTIRHILREYPQSHITLKSNLDIWSPPALVEYARRGLHIGPAHAGTTAYPSATDAPNLLTAIIRQDPGQAQWPNSLAASSSPLLENPSDSYKLEVSWHAPALGARVLEESSLTDLLIDRCNILGIEFDALADLASVHPEVSLADLATSLQMI